VSRQSQRFSLQKIMNLGLNMDEWCGLWSCGL
jgi:hypothetical protein